MTGPLASLADAAPAIAMLAAFACAIGGGWMVAKNRDRRKGVLLIVMATVLVGNVAIWTV